MLDGLDPKALWKRVCEAGTRLTCAQQHFRPFRKRNTPENSSDFLVKQRRHTKTLAHRRYFRVKPSQLLCNQTVQTVVDTNVEQKPNANTAQLADEGNGKRS